MLERSKELGTEPVGEVSTPPGLDAGSVLSSGKAAEDPSALGCSDAASKAAEDCRTPKPAAPGPNRALGVSLRLDWAEEELQAAHQACLEVDKEFAHEVCQFVFAVGCMRESWKARHPSSPKGSDAASRLAGTLAPPAEGKTKTEDEAPSSPKGSAAASEDEKEGGEAAGGGGSP